jgi:hypothetical protein
MWVGGPRVTQRAYPRLKEGEAGGNSRSCQKNKGIRSISGEQIIKIVLVVLCVLCQGQDQDPRRDRF